MALRKLYKTQKLIFNGFNAQSLRCFSVSAKKCEKVVASENETRLNWDRAIEEAVKCVGYQTPYLSLQYLTKDDDVNWFKNIEKLETSSHPMKDTSK